MGLAPPDRPPVPRPLALPLSALYGRVIASRNRRFDAGRGVVELDRPVVSVGNLSVGGTGKTPMVMHVLLVLRAAGLSPCVAMRGYASRGGESDEAGEYLRALPDVPVVARPDRVEGLIELFATERGRACSAIVLDDGFQHRRLARDIDVVLLDATRDAFADALLPMGRLREPVSSLARAGAIVITHAEAVGAPVVAEAERRVRELRPGLPLAVCEHAWTDLRVVEAAHERSEPVEWLRGKAVAASCAIGNPSAFLACVAGAVGHDPVASLVLPDHAAYDGRAIGRLFDLVRRHRASVIVITEKDWSKLRLVRPDQWPCAVVRPRLSLRLVRGGAELDAKILEAVRARPYAPPDADDGRPSSTATGSA